MVMRPAPPFPPPARPPPGICGEGSTNSNDRWAKRSVPPTKQMVPSGGEDVPSNPQISMRQAVMLTLPLSLIGWALICALFYAIYRLTMH